MFPRAESFLEHWNHEAKRHTLLRQYDSDVSNSVVLAADPQDPSLDYFFKTPRRESRFSKNFAGYAHRIPLSYWGICNFSKI